MRNYILLLVTTFIGISCSQQGGKSSQNEPVNDFEILSSDKAAEAVCRDSLEGYFEKVTILEMNIQLQMKTALNDRKELLFKYKEMLKSDVEDFSNSEKELIEKRFNEALYLCNKFDKNLKLPKIGLIKTKGSYYGAGVYYTRENNIIIPAPQLKEENPALLRTLLHEIFHIYSRYNPNKRDSLYSLIGYNKIDSLVLSDFLEKRIFYNPDGVDVAYVIEVSDSSGRKFKAIPSIYSKFSSYRDLPLLKSFVFQLFEVEKNGNFWQVVNKDIGYSEEQIKAYWDKIGTNTKYTIHPDEVLADNFTFLVLSKSNPKELDRFTEQGKTLIAKIEEIIKN